MKIVFHIGSYFKMLIGVFKNPVKWSITKPLIYQEIDILVIKSLGIIAFMSLFIGAVSTIQLELNLTNPLLPRYMIGLGTRQSIILEFSPTFVSVLMAGKIGSYITSSIGTMRVTQQIDALKMMGINDLYYLVFPKIVAMMFYPIAIVFSMFFGLLGGYIISYFGISSATAFVEGLFYDFNVFHVFYALIKVFVFAFILATVPAYHAYFIRGGAIEVGKATTRSTIWTSISIVLANFILTDLILGL